MGPPLRNPFTKQQFTPPDTTDPSCRPLTASERILADRIAHGEISPPTSEHSLIALDDEIVPNEGVSWKGDPPLSTRVRQASYQTRQPRRQNRFPVSDVAAVNPSDDDITPAVVPSTHETEPSDDDSVLYEEDNIVDLTKSSDEGSDIVETMTSGQPRRACAPKSFKGILAEADKMKMNARNPRHPANKDARASERRRIKNMLLMSKYLAEDVRREKPEAVPKIEQADNSSQRRTGDGTRSQVSSERAYRLAIPRRNKQTHNFANRGKGDGRRSKVATKRATRLADRKMKATQSGAIAKKRGKQRKQRAQNPQQGMQQRKRYTKMNEVAEGIRRDEAAYNHVVPIQAEIQGSVTKNQSKKSENILPASWSRDMAKTEPELASTCVQTSRPPYAGGSQERVQKRRDGWGTKTPEISIKHEK